MGVTSWRRARPGDLDVVDEPVVPCRRHLSVESDAEVGRHREAREIEIVVTVRVVAVGRGEDLHGREGHPVRAHFHQGLVGALEGPDLGPEGQAHILRARETQRPLEVPRVSAQPDVTLSFYGPIHVGPDADVAGLRPRPAPAGSAEKVPDSKPSAAIDSGAGVVKVKSPETARFEAASRDLTR